LIFFKVFGFHIFCKEIIIEVIGVFLDKLGFRGICHDLFVEHDWYTARSSLVKVVPAAVDISANIVKRRQALTCGDLCGRPSGVASHSPC